jgi:hypothetical protein
LASPVTLTELTKPVASSPVATAVALVPASTVTVPFSPVEVVPVTSVLDLPITEAAPFSPAEETPETGTVIDCPAVTVTDPISPVASALEDRTVTTRTAVTATVPVSPLASLPVGTTVTLPAV